MYYGTFDGQAVITVTYCVTGTGKWQLLYDALDNREKVAHPDGSASPWVQKDDSKVWKQAVFHLGDARFANGQGNGAADFSIDCMGDDDEYVSFVEVTKGGGIETATLQGSVDLQGRPSKPGPTWSVPLTVTVGGTPYAATTDQWGQFTVSGLAPGMYDITVKNSHTLSNIRRNYTLGVGANVVYMGELKEGDASCDDRVDSSDFLLLRGSYFKSAGQPGFVDGADFNEDGTVNSSDFLLLRANYFESGPIALSGGQGAAKALTSQAPTTSAVSIAIEPQSTAVDVGGRFNLDVWIDAGSAELAAADVYIDFDPSLLEVVQVVGGPVLAMLAEQHDNSEGRVAIGAGTLGAPATGSFVLASLRFEVKAGGGGGVTAVTFSREQPRQTVVKDTGDHDLLETAADGTVEIVGVSGEESKVYLPCVSR